MDRKEFIKKTSLLSAGVIVTPNSLFAQEEWIIDILGELAKAILVDVIEKPIEQLLQEMFASSDMEDDIRQKNEEYAKNDAYERNQSYLVNGSVFYPLASKYDENRAGHYIVPFDHYQKDQNYRHICDMQKQEAETMAWAAQHLHEKQGISKEIRIELAGGEGGR